MFKLHLGDSWPQTFRHGKNLSMEQHWSALTFLYLNIEVWVTTTTYNQQWGMENI